jgi:large subunit ribosomal protein L25
MENRAETHGQENLPDAIPSVIEINIQSLRIGESIHINDITLPEGVEPLIRDRNFTIAAIAGRGGKKADAEGAEAGA